MLSLAELVDKIVHEIDHVALTNSTTKVRSSANAEQQQHRVICATTKRATDCNQVFCAEQGECGSCSATKNLLKILDECGLSATPSPVPEVSKLARLIYPLEPTPSSGWPACFAGLLPTGLGGVPLTCAAQQCSPEQSISVLPTTCQCSTSPGPRFGVPPSCLALTCLDGMPVLGPVGCICG